MSSTLNADDTIAALQADMAALKHDVSSLLSHLKAGASSSAQNAAGKIDDKAQRLYRQVADSSEHSAHLLSEQITAQPLVAMAVMFGVGFVSGRLLSR